MPTFYNFFCININKVLLEIPPRYSIGPIFLSSGFFLSAASVLVAQFGLREGQREKLLSYRKLKVYSEIT